MSDLAQVAWLMDEFLRNENHALTGENSRLTLTLEACLMRISILEHQVRTLRIELHEADAVIFDTNLRNHDLNERNELLRERVVELAEELDGLSDGDTTILASDTEHDPRNPWDPNHWNEDI